MNFVYAKPHPKVEPCWYWRITTADELMRAHEWLTNTSFLKWIKNPHFFDEKGEPKDTMSAAMHPVLLGAGWLSTALKIFTRCGKVFMGVKGGMCDPATAEILKEVQCDQWPEDGTVVISQWVGGQHFHAMSITKDFGKFDTLEQARAAIEKECPGAPIAIEGRRGQYFYKQEGD